MLLEAGKDGRHQRDKSAALQQSVEGQNQVFRIDAPADRQRRVDRLTIVHRDQPAQRWVIGPQNRFDRYGGQCILLKVECIDKMLGIVADGFWRHIGPQLRVAEIDHARVIAGNAVHGPGAKPHNEPHKAVFALQTCVPHDWAVAVGNTGQRREVILAMPFALHFLQQDRHPFIVIQQTHAAAIDERIWTENAGVHLADRKRQIT